MFKRRGRTLLRPHRRGSRASSRRLLRKLERAGAWRQDFQKPRTSREQNVSLASCAQAESRPPSSARAHRPLSSLAPSRAPGEQCQSSPRAGRGWRARPGRGGGVDPAWQSGGFLLSAQSRAPAAVAAEHRCGLGGLRALQHGEGRVAARGCSRDLPEETSTAATPTPEGQVGPPEPASWGLERPGLWAGSSPGRRRLRHAKGRCCHGRRPEPEAEEALGVGSGA